jgi:preprotein translocase subunit YajC
MVFHAFLLEAAPQAPGPLAQFAPLIFIGVIFYFLLIRPQQKQRKEAQKLMASIKSGDKVVTGSGIHGLITNVKETTVILKIAENVKIEIDRSAIVTILESASGENGAPAAS